jgi:hypothetical protein
MAIYHQEEEMIPDALASGLSGIEEQLDLGWIEEVFRPMWVSGGTLNIIQRTLAGSRQQLPLFRTIQVCPKDLPHRSAAD